MGRVDKPSVNGILVVDKPAGLTSHDVVARVRRMQHTRDVGHTGTLDPFATGVMVLGLGEGLKLVAHLTEQDKIYEAEVVLGVQTDSLDGTGTKIAEAPVPLLGTLEDPAPALLAALDAERARTAQIPPAISAIHVDGVRAYERARRGESVDLPPRAVAVRALELLAVYNDRLRLRVHTGKGYYVRALARDLATAVGTVGHLSTLRRLQSGAFTLADARALDAPPLALPEVLRRLFPVVQVGEHEAIALGHGKRIAAPAEIAVDTTVACMREETPIALVRRQDEELIVLRGFRV